MPLKEPTAYHIARVRQILGACDAKLPQEEVAVRILVGSGVRASELCGLAICAPDGLGDLMLDSLMRGRVELRVPWDGSAKGMKSRRVPITPKLASAIKRYQARHYRPGAVSTLLVNERGGSYTRFGVDALMDRLEKRVGFHVHAHGFRPHVSDGGDETWLEFRTFARSDGAGDVPQVVEFQAVQPPEMYCRLSHRKPKGLQRRTH